MDRYTIDQEDLEYIFNRTEAFKSLDGDVLLIGGTGFIGIWLVESFLYAKEKIKYPYSIHVLCRDSTSALERFPHLRSREGVHLRQADVRDVTFWCRPKYVIHAGCQSVGRDDDKDPYSTWDIIVNGTQNALEFAVNTHAKRFLFISSGIAKCSFQSSDTSSVYAQAKRSAEHLCFIYQKQFGIPVTVARGYSFIGPHLPLDAHYAAGNFIRDGLKGGPIVVNGDGTSERCYMYASDMSHKLWSLCLYGEKTNPCDVGIWTCTSTLQLANIIADEFNPRPEVVVKNDLYTLNSRLVTGDDTIIESIGYTKLDKAVSKTISWHKRRM